jgi:hypothetical protein
MPSIQTASIPVTSFPNEFVSPWGNDEVIPLYSSVPLKTPAVGCLPCVVCGNSSVRDQIVANASGLGRAKFGVNTRITTTRRFEYAYYIEYSQNFTAINSVYGGFFPSSGGWSALAFFDSSDVLISAEGTANLSVTGYAGLNSPGYAYNFGELSISGPLTYNPSTSLYYWATTVSTNMQGGIVPGPYSPGGRSSQFNATCRQDNFTFTSIETMPWIDPNDFNRTGFGDQRWSSFQWNLIWGDLVATRHDN